MNKRSKTTHLYTIIFNFLYVEKGFKNIVVTAKFLIKKNLFETNLNVKVGIFIMSVFKKLRKFEANPWKKNNKGESKVGTPSSVTEVMSLSEKFLNFEAMFNGSNPTKQIKGRANFVAVKFRFCENADLS